jgi:hypothetical protein
MSYDITKKRVAETGDIELKNPDGSPMLDDNGDTMSVTVHSPGSKVWQQAEAEKNRVQAKRMRDNGGKVEAVFDHARTSAIEFLTRITISFNGWTYPVADGENAFRAAYSDDLLGYIRDQVFEKSRDWASFTKGSAKS